MTATVVGVGRTFGRVVAPAVNLALIVGLVLAVFAFCVGLTVGTAWTFSTIDGWVHPAHHNQPADQVCWIQPGSDGLQSVRGARSEMPTDDLKAYQVPCN